MMNSDLLERRKFGEAPCFYCKYCNCSYDEYPCSKCSNATEEDDWPGFVENELLEEAWFDILNS